MTNTLSVTACARYGSDETIMRIARELAAAHRSVVHVATGVTEDTGDVIPGFIVAPRRVGGSRCESTPKSEG